MITIKKTAIYQVDNVPSISIELHINTYDGASKIASAQGPRRAFCPGEIAGVTEWLEGCENSAVVINLCENIWPVEVVADYQSSLTQNAL